MSTEFSAEAMLAAPFSQDVDEHLREVIKLHFSPETGTPFWLEWAAEAGWDPREEIKTRDDLQKFPHFEDNSLRYTPLEKWIPRAFAGQPFSIFETGGTTGMPKQRIGWHDFKYDYEQFSHALSDEDFPRGTCWLMMGPTGPRRLRLAIEHLANYRGGSCFFVDLDPRYVKKLIKRGEYGEAQMYMEHVVDQAATILRYREVSALFSTPKLVEALSERTSIPDAGIKGIFCGGTEMNPQTVRFTVEEVLENRCTFLPVYGNTLMGLAHSIPLGLDYSVNYYPPQPRALLRVLDDNDQVVDYGDWGRVELTTLTREFFMPRFLERDEAMRTKPTEAYPWDGVAEVRPYRDASAGPIVEGVY